VDEVLTMPCPDCEGAGEIRCVTPPEELGPALAAHYPSGLPWRWALRCLTCGGRALLSVVLVVTDADRP
jgi:hypothetical protein